nr:amino acid decarboxylase [Enterococcus sp. 665A]MBO1339630.1 amino acid decarboxylase [Enterococcus sp. 665A]
MLKMNQTVVKTQAAGFTMSAEAKQIGGDLLITLTGGDTPHIGTVTTFSRNQKRESLRFESHSGRFHKDDVLAEKLLETLAPFIPGNCVITSGVHVNGITQEQIAASFDMAAQLSQQLADWLKKTPFTSKAPIYKKNHDVND